MPSGGGTPPPSGGAETFDKQLPPERMFVSVAKNTSSLTYRVSVIFHCDSSKSQQHEGPAGAGVGGAGVGVSVQSFKRPFWQPGTECKAESRELHVQALIRSKSWSWQVILRWNLLFSTNTIPFFDMVLIAALSTEPLQPLFAYFF